MARPPIDLAALSPRLASSPAPGDQRLVNSELQTLSIFGKLAKKIDFREFPGDFSVARNAWTRVVCSRRSRAATAFYVLTAEDVLALRRRQLERRQKAAAPIVDASGAEAAPAEEPAAGSSQELGILAEEIARLESLSQDKTRPLATALAVHVIPVEQQRLRRRRLAGGRPSSIAWLGQQTSSPSSNSTFPSTPRSRSTPSSAAARCSPATCSAR